MPIDSMACTHSTSWISICCATLALSLFLAFLPARRAIPSLVESDYCYLLLAADRLLDGYGLTSLQPVAPHQPWAFQYEWGFLTQWPAGYPVLIASIRWLLGCTSLEACRLVSIAGCGAGLIGWFAFLRRMVPSGVTGYILAGVAASTAFAAGFLINPSTDLVLIAALPFVMLLVLDSCSNQQRPISTVALLAAAGSLSGIMVWFRYAAIFLPFAVGLFLLLEWTRRRLSIRALLAFIASAGLWITALVVVNSSFSPTESTAQRFNLGESLGFDLTFAMLAQSWWTFTDFGYYAHHPIAHWIVALAPFAYLPILFFPRLRTELIKLLSLPSQRLAVCAMVTLLVMIVAITALFGGKFDYVGLERYYLPVRPLYLVCLLAPLMLGPRRAVRAAMLGGLLLLGSWTFSHEWSAPLSRWTDAKRPSTPAGAWSRIFEPGAMELYQWLRVRGDDPSLLIISNFHEFLALESGLVTVPVPQSEEELAPLLADAARIRGLKSVTPIFVLHPENLWRAYWLPDVDAVRQSLNLKSIAGPPAGAQRYLFTRSAVQPTCDDSLISISWN